MVSRAELTREDTLQIRNGLLEACFTLRFFLVNASLEELLVNVYELLVNFLLKLTIVTFRESKKHTLDKKGKHTRFSSSPLVGDPVQSVHW